MGGSLNWEEIEDIYQRHPQLRDKIKSFFETGTYKGHTTRMASKHFDKVYTCEIVETLYNESVNTGRNEGCTNIEYYLGDSVEILKSVMPNLANVPCLYFIDAHQSGPDTSNNGKEYVPLLTELDVILSHNKGVNLFIIDDARFWYSTFVKPWDWSGISLEKILAMFESKGAKVKDHYLCNDRYIIVTD